MQRTLCGVVGDVSPPVVEEACRCVLASEHVVHRLGDIAVRESLAYSVLVAATDLPKI
jgi:hypothetical protein